MYENPKDLRIAGAAAGGAGLLGGVQQFQAAEAIVQGVKVAPVKAELEMLDKAIAALLNRVEAVVQRIDPILTPGGPGEANQAQDVRAEPVKSSLAVQIHTLRRQLETAASKLHAVTTRIEL